MLFQKALKILLLAPQKLQFASVKMDCMKHHAIVDFTSWTWTEFSTSDNTSHIGLHAIPCNKKLLKY